MINTAWLTLNRLCNFRCPWCYAESTNFLKKYDMPWDLAKELVDFCCSINVKNINLIGGEPTCYHQLIDIIKYIKSKKIHVSIITNGYKFHDLYYLKQIENSGADLISFSLKGANPDQYKKLTGVDAFDKIVQAIKNLRLSKKLSTGYSVVVTNDTINNLVEFASFMHENSPESFIRFSFCRPSAVSEETMDTSSMPNLQEFVEKLIEQYGQIDKIMDGKLVIEQSLPQCIWPKDFIEKLKEKNQMQFGCHLQNRGGIIFDYDGSVIPCNILTSYSIGKYKEDFRSVKEFEKFWLQEDLVDLYDKIYCYPSQECVLCKKYTECGGGCALNWLTYNSNIVKRI